MRKFIGLLLVGIIVWPVVAGAGDTTTAYEIIDRADRKLRGKSSRVRMNMKIVRPDWSRKVSFQAWSLERKYSLIVIEAPARDEGNAFLKRGQELWHWVPSIERIIKLPPSMMMQSWMGSDFTNDDLIRESSIVYDYNHTRLGDTVLTGTNLVWGDTKTEKLDCFLLKAVPKPEAPVVWGKLLIWISKKYFVQVKTEFYDESGELIKKLKMGEIKQMDGRMIPSHLEMIPLDDPGQKTVIDYREIDFNIGLSPDFFSRQNIKRFSK